MSKIIQLKEVTKKYNDTEVVSDVTMAIEKGRIYGFLGPNGAGKTTIMRMILNLVKPTMGCIQVFGETIKNDSYTYLKRIGSIVEYPVFYDKLTAMGNLKFHCEYMGFYDKKKIEEVLDLVDLNGAEDKIVSEFSLGMKQRLGIARAMITSPELLILDEPINGLDPLGIKAIRELFLKLRNDYGTTLLISSHIITEIEQVADEIGVIDRGKLIKEVSMEQVRRDAIQYLDIQVDDIKKATAILDTRLKINNYKLISDFEIRIYQDNITQNEVSRALILGGVNVYGMNSESDTLEEYFLDIVNGGHK
jgi:ABC-2 type transport system ATP-binding protein